MPNADRELAVSMRDYIKRAVTKFLVYFGGKSKKVSSPFLPDGEWGADEEEAGAMQSSCSSHAATVLFLARVCRPECSVAVQRLCSHVTRWTRTLDQALHRLFSFLDSTADWELVGKLSPLDVDDLSLDVYPDADWNGDPHTTKSTSGLFIELHAEGSDNTFPLTWKTQKQTFTGSSTAETETVSASNAIRHEGIPIQDLFEVFLGKRLPMRVKIDNTQAILVIKRGYSKKLKSLQRCHRVALGALHELI